MQAKRVNIKVAVPPPAPSPRFSARCNAIQRSVPSYGVKIEGTNDLALIHRADPATGTAKGTIRAYLTVYAHADKGYKDIHASVDGQGIKFIDKTDDTMTNLGDPRRAFHYIATYSAQGAKCPIIRSFDIPRDLYDVITGTAISETQRAKLGTDKTYNVDQPKGQNQFGVSPKVRDTIEKLGSNLISYVPAEYVDEMGKKPVNGTVMDIDVLRKSLGMPTEGRKFMAPLVKNKVINPTKDAEHGAVLSRLYDDLDLLVRIKQDKNYFSILNQELKIHQRCFKGSGAKYYGAHIASLLPKEQIPKKSLEELIKFRDEVGAAATFSVIPEMVREEYLQASAQLHGQDKDKKGRPLSSWAKKQKYVIAERPIVKPEAKEEKAMPKVVVVAPPRDKQTPKEKSDLNYVLEGTIFGDGS